MRCPFCQHSDDRVVDSRESGDGGVTRRRRECLSCQRRYTTYERVDIVMPLVVKKDGRREAWDRAKLVAGFQKACEKRPVSADAIEDSVAGIERATQERGVREISSNEVGEQVMERLKRLDEVAYVRFASVYLSFRDISEFHRTVETLLSERKRTPDEPGVRPREIIEPPVDRASGGKQAGSEGRKEAQGKRERPEGRE